MFCQIDPIVVSVPGALRMVFLISDLRSVAVMFFVFRFLGPPPRSLRAVA